MSKSLTSLDAVLEPRNLRRRLLPLASSAALGLTGCMAAHPAPMAAGDLAAQQEAIQRVQNFTSGMDSAVDKADPARLKMSAAISAPTAENGRGTGQAVLASSAVNAAADPVAADVAKISHAPIATLTSVNQGVSGVPVSLGVMTAMNDSALDRVVTKAAAASKTVMPDVPSAVVSTTQPTTAPATVNAALLPARGDVTSAIPRVEQKAAVPVVTPAATTQAVAAEPSIDASMNVLRKQMAAHPTLNGALALALLDTAQGHVPDPTAAASLSAPDQKLCSDLLAALQGMTTPISASTTLAERAAPLVDAAKKWQVDADLSLPKLALASRVDSFGVYSPVEAKFVQGVKRTVIIYCEVANFAFKKTDDGWYETHLSQQDTLLTDDGLLIWRPTAEEVEDRSMNRRRDFYLVKKLIIPDTLAAGKYLLRMSVTDRTTNKFAMTNLPIEITEK